MCHNAECLALDRNACDHYSCRIFVQLMVEFVIIEFDNSVNFVTDVVLVFLYRQWRCNSSFACAGTVKVCYFWISKECIEIYLWADNWSTWNSQHGCAHMFIRLLVVSDLSITLPYRTFGAGTSLPGFLQVRENWKKSALVRERSGDNFFLGKVSDFSNIQFLTFVRYGYCFDKFREILIPWLEKSGRSQGILL